MNTKCCSCDQLKELSEIFILTCSHAFCWICIEDYLKKTLKPKVKCPLASCDYYMKDNEIRKILSADDITKYDEICIAALSQIHKCILPECDSVYHYNDFNIQFDCEQCTIFNCVKCKRAHKNMKCEALVNRDGKSLDFVCEEEIKRASSFLQKKMAKIYRENLVETNKNTLIPATNIFNCQICCKDVGKSDGVILRQCFHQICKDCLREHVRNCSSIPVACPFSPCPNFLEDCECRQILNDADRDLFENKSITRASKNLEKPDHCRQYNCNYLCDLDKALHSYTCPKCKSVNCVDCDAIHVNQTCKEYLNSKTMSKDEENIEKLIKEKKLMRCLDCRTILQKTGGCNWIPCPNCGVELCWINQMHRWGPKGPGDISGGCKCGVDFKFCHPSCGGCIADVGRRHSRYRGIIVPNEGFMIPPILLFPRMLGLEPDLLPTTTRGASNPSLPVPSREFLRAEFQPNNILGRPPSAQNTPNIISASRRVLQRPQGRVSASTGMTNIVESRTRQEPGTQPAQNTSNIIPIANRLPPRPPPS